MFIRDYGKLDKTLLPLVTPDLPNLVDFLHANDAYLFGSRDMGSRPGRRARMVRAQIGEDPLATDFDFTLPYDRSLINELKGSYGFLEGDIKTQYHPDDTMVDDSSKDPADDSALLVKMSDASTSLMGKKTGTHPTIQIIFRRPNKYDMFIYVWDRLTVDMWYNCLWKSSPDFIGISLGDDGRRKMQCAIMNGMYSQYQENHLV